MPSISEINKLLDHKRIEKQNKRFHKLSRRKQRLAIAKDVLAQLKAKKYVAEPGTYIHVLEALFDSNGEQKDLQKVLLSTAAECNVCGLGAAFCSMARLGDEVTASDGEVENIHKTLKSIFSERQIALIEYAFEGADAGDLNILSENEADACGRFYEKRGNDDKRLAAIFRNIIKNDGTFKP